MLEKIGSALDQLLGILSVMLLWLLPAGLGRGVWYAEAIRTGERKLAFGLVMVEAATAVFCALVGGGIAEHLELKPFAALALIGVVSWLGPNGAFALALRFLRRGPAPK